MEFRGFGTLKRAMQMEPGELFWLEDGKLVVCVTKRDNSVTVGRLQAAPGQATVEIISMNVYGYSVGVDWILTATAHGKIETDEGRIRHNVIAGLSGPWFVFADSKGNLYYKPSVEGYQRWTDDRFVQVEAYQIWENQAALESATTQPVFTYPDAS